jgi:hypothetical protein
MRLTVKIRVLQYCEYWASITEHCNLSVFFLWKYICLNVYEGGRVASSPRYRPPLPPGYIPGNFRYTLSRTQGHSAVGRIMSMKTSCGSNGNRTRNRPVCCTVPQTDCSIAYPTFTVISWWIRLIMRNVSDKSCRDNQSTHFVFSNFSFLSKLVPFMR